MTVFLVFTKRMRLSPMIFDNYYEADEYRNRMLGKGESEVYLIEKTLGPGTDDDESCDR